ncbi:MAG: FAD-binding oxidoreductase [Candidatus Endonucleobacter bathymodioli]|uniref:FAD-binding oxidoreductase n=1 Tax=Candidatus Endonucleibacter bathymodioli TaxID=539814 RepID=A0AA90SY64_9GAMM|nr:FAD-binding oxidoreductase [Candidatus Endonucleobacter bathymodioli]
MARAQFNVILTGKTSLSDQTMELEFQFAGETTFQHKAGQFVQLLFEHEETEYKRSYSIASAPEFFHETGKLQIAISFVTDGVASAFFQNAALGAVMMLSGPFGVLTLPESLEGKLILIGTGTGIAPYRAMIPKLLTMADSDRKIIILMGGRYQSEIIYKNDFQELTSSNPYIDYRICLSRESPDNLQEGEYSGYVQHQLNHLNLNPDNDITYLCGNPSMVDDAAAQLKDMLFESKKIKREKYVYSGH